MIHELGADALERANRLPELAPLEGVRARGVVGALREADGQRSNPDPSRIEHLEGVHETLALRTQKLVLRHAAILEDHLARLARPHAEFVFLPAGPDTGRVHFHDERGNTAGAPAAVAHRHHDDY